MPAHRTAEDKNRVLQEGDTYSAARRTTGNEWEALARNAIALHPNLPAANLVAEIIALADPELLAALDQTLRAKYFIQTVKGIRARARREESAQSWLFPDVQQHATKLPPKVPIGDGKSVARADVRYEDLKRYLKVLNQRDREGHKKRIAAVKALMALWPKRTPKTRGLTLHGVDAAKARRAGLIE